MFLHLSLHAIWFSECHSRNILGFMQLEFHISFKDRHWGRPRVFCAYYCDVLSTVSVVNVPSSLENFQRVLCQVLHTWEMFNDCDVWLKIVFRPNSSLFNMVCIMLAHQCFISVECSEILNLPQRLYSRSVVKIILFQFPWLMELEIAIIREFFFFGSNVLLECYSN
jgi:hypothetical protein